jgi:uncharacterized membrane protein YfcA
MQPVDERTAFSFAGRGSTAIIPALGLFLFATNLAVSPAGGSSVVAPTIVLLSALVSSIAGFAFSPIAGAFLFYAMKEPLSVIQILLVASISQQLYCLWRLRENIHLRDCFPYLVGSIATLPLGLFLLLRTPASTFLPLLGLLLIFYGAFSALKPSLPAGNNPVWGRVTVGALGGITGGIAAFPAAFVTMWCHIQGFDKHRARSIIQPFILVNQVLSLTALLLLKPPNVMALGTLQYAAPAVLGAYLGLMIFNRVETSTFNRLVGLFLIFAGFSFIKSF